MAKKFKSFDIKKEVEDYLYKKSWKVQDNSNQNFSFSFLSWRIAGEVITKYTLAEIYPPKISNAHLNGDIHLHNLYMGIVGYCAGWSLRDLLLEGFRGLPMSTVSAPPKHFSTALLQMINFIGALQNEWAGAQAFNSLDVFLAPFIRKDKLTYKQVKQNLQQFIYNLNTPSRWGGQTPFVNITMDVKVPDDLKNERVIIGGKLQKQTYKDFQKEIDLINQAFCEIMIKGDEQGRVFSFPIPTYNITKDFDWDSKTADLIFEMTAKYGIPYFQNFLKSDLDPHSIRAMCCHLRLDLNQFHRRMGGFFGYADKTGSVGVVTINLPRLGYLAENKKDFFKRLAKLMDLAKDSLEIKREVILENMKNGLIPFSKNYLGTLNFHFSTIGTCGMHEACLNFLKKGIETEEGKNFSIEVLEFMKNKLLNYQKQTGNIYNLEATPAESTAYRFAKIDKKKFSKIITAGKKLPYYTNSTWLPVNYTADVFEALEHQEPLQILYNGGTIFHAFLGEKLTRDGTKTLVRKILNTYKIPYLTLTPTFSICPDHGYISGEHFKCPTCKRPAEVYSRIVGYLRPVQNWNEGKKEEFKDRLEYR